LPPGRPSRPTVHAGTGLAFALAIAAAASAPLAAQTIRDPEVVSLRFEGNAAFSSGDLESVIRSRETKCKGFLLQPICAISDFGFAHTRQYLDTLDVVEDELRLQLYYRDRGFFSAAVDSRITRAESKAGILFTIREGEPTLIDSLAIRGVPDVLDSAEVARVVGLEAGDRFDQFRLQVAEDSLVRALREQGYIQAAVLEDLLRPPGAGARVTLDVSAGPRFTIGQIHVEGAEGIGEGVVRSLLRTGSGRVYRQSQIDDSQRTLFGVDAIRFASIQPEAAGDSIVDLRVRVTPASTRAARGGFGWSTDQCLRAEARLTHRNLFGGAKRFEVTARLSNLFAQQLGGRFPCSDVGQDTDFRTLNFLLQGELTVPVFFGGRNAFRASLHGQRETVPDVFIREEVGGQLGVTRQLRRGMSATLSYQPSFTGFDEQSADIFFCVAFGFCTPDDISTVTKARWLAPITLNWIDSRTNDPLQPTNGHYLTVDLERAAGWTGSDYRYYRVRFQAADFESIEPGLVAAFRLRGGWVKATGGLVDVQDPTIDENVLHPSKRFFAGGSQSVRGFGQNLLGPRVLVADQEEDCPTEVLQDCVERLSREKPGAFAERPRGGNAGLELSVELRQRLSGRWGMVLFVDAGGVWEDLGQIRAPTWTPGAGLRFLSPVGPLRFDIGYNPSGAERLPVVVSLQNGSLVELPDRVLYDPFAWDSPGWFTEFWRRLQFHFSIGEAF